MGQLSMDKVFLLAAYIEVMVAISCVMFFLATFHLVMNCVRMLAGYVDHATTPGGPVAYLGNLRPWDHILKDTLYATQENLGSAAAIYRCWILYNKNWKVTVLPIALLLTNFVAGYTVCATYAEVNPTETVFSSRLDRWIKTFYSIAVILNITTTSLMAYRIYGTHRQSSSYNVGKSKLLPILAILIESAALQLVVEVVLLALYCSSINAQYIVLESVTSIVGITFNAITLRIKLHVMSQSSSRIASAVTHPEAVQTIGSIPMRRINIKVTKDVEDYPDSTYTYTEAKGSHA
ncbi:hypothetical protein H0H92_011251 [Tricholoma furcatifolium]|nr:hypothetical protein H0H92_011251 [Tricholoma furcatifolium]